MCEKTMIETRVVATQINFSPFDSVILPFKNDGINRAYMIRDE